MQQPEKLIECGFKEKTINNLVSQLKLSQTIAIEDWRFWRHSALSAFGLASAESLLQHHPIENIFELTEEQILNRLMVLLRRPQQLLLKVLTVSKRNLKLFST